jgi:hypothetical protein
VLSVKELNQIAVSMKADELERQLGPFVLVLQPPSQEAQQRALKLGAGRTGRLSSGPTDTVSLILQLEHLMVATLPEVPPEGLLVGRLPDCELVVDDPSVSKHHARLTWDDGFGSAVVEDLDSSNGTLHNAAPVRGAVSLHDGDELSFGDVRYCYLRTRTLHARLSTGQFKAK